MAWQKKKKKSTREKRYSEMAMSAEETNRSYDDDKHPWPHLSPLFSFRGSKDKSFLMSCKLMWKYQPFTTPL